MANNIEHQDKDALVSNCDRFLCIDDDVYQIVR